jgi:hypothetical protein
VEQHPTPPESDYAVRFAVEYPDRELNRLTTFFRLIVAIPILVVLGAVAGSVGTQTGGASGGGYAAAGGGVLFLPTLLMIVFRQKYPRWWYDWNRELLRFSTRVGIYMALMDDRYPSTDEQQSVRLDMDYPDASRDLNRWLPLVKWLLAIPHYVILFFLVIAALVAVVLAWFAILFTGRFPRSLFGFLEGVGRWELRVVGYAFALVTDRYPPFRLSP